MQHINSSSASSAVPWQLVMRLGRLVVARDMATPRATAAALVSVCRGHVRRYDDHDISTPRLTTLNTRSVCERNCVASCQFEALTAPRQQVRAFRGPGPPRHRTHAAPRTHALTASAATPADCSRAQSSTRLGRRA
jgi:hypothetical protein